MMVTVTVWPTCFRAAKWAIISSKLSMASPSMAVMMSPPAHRGCPHRSLPIAALQSGALIEPPSTTAAVRLV
jgi:hypothetical protein